MGKALCHTYTTCTMVPQCVAGRAVRRQHPKQSRRSHIVPDTDKDQDGPVMISMGHVYLHGRVEKNKDERFNPPYLVVVEHTYGRCWAYQVPNKGCQDESQWVPRRLIQDWDNAGLTDMRIMLKTGQEPSMTR